MGTHRSHEHAVVWRPFDAERLTHIGVPEPVATALTDRGLPENAYEHFVRVPERELEIAHLPEAGQAAFLAQVEDGYNNTYWLALAGGAVWMRYGGANEPVHHMKQINTSVPRLQAVLEVWCAFKAQEPDVEDDDQAYQGLIEQSVLRAVAADPEAFTDSENWWARTFEQVGYNAPRILLGDKPLYHYTRRDESGHWALEHPGYDDEEL